MAFTAIQNNSFALGAIAASNSGTLTTPVTGGSLLVVTAYFNTDTVNAGSNNITSITSTGSPTWTQAINVLGDTGAGTPSAEIWYAPNAPSGSTTITVNHTHSALYNSSGTACVIEFGGVATTSPLVVTSQYQSSVSEASYSAPVSGDTTGDLVVALSSSTAGTPVIADINYTYITSDATFEVDARLSGSTSSSYSVAYTTNFSGFSSLAISTFKVGSVSPPTPMAWGGMLLDLSIFPAATIAAIKRLMMMGIGSLMRIGA